eukprot:11804328-Alexandrium_andersonii.AAC.1
MRTSQGQFWTRSWLRRPAPRRFGSWSPGACGASDQSPSASPAPARSLSGGDGWAVIRGCDDAE